MLHFSCVNFTVFLFVLYCRANKFFQAYGTTAGVIASLQSALLVEDKRQILREALLPLDFG
jgi:hypothetical protein